ncbi:MAG TPA: VOC family protein [Bryobacteraceae bacterium]|jgi:catechol 2,3-dioxygenase-like lactoylglutathione lyase family enzyme
MINTPSTGLPGLRGTEHVGFTVPDLEEATRFFVDVIGCECVFEVGQFMADGDWMATHLNVDPRTIMRKLRFFRCRHGSNFEIFQYEAPGQKLEPPKNSDVGGHHLAFYVDDMDAAVAYLRAKGVRLLGEPTLRTAGPNAGQHWIYFLAPWGMQFELVSFPNGKGYEKTTPLRLWHPARPAE